MWNTRLETDFIAPLGDAGNGFARQISIPTVTQGARLPVATIATPRSVLLATAGGISLASALGTMKRRGSSITLEAKGRGDAISVVLMPRSETARITQHGKTILDDINVSANTRIADAVPTSVLYADKSPRDANVRGSAPTTQTLIRLIRMALALYAEATSKSSARRPRHRQRRGESLDEHEDLPSLDREYMMKKLLCESSKNNKRKS